MTVNQLDYLMQISLQIHKLNSKQCKYWSNDLYKPSDLGLHSLQGRTNPGSARQGLAASLMLINPLYSGGLFHPYILEESIAVSKQWRPWSDTALCDVWSGSALFAYVPFLGSPDNELNIAADYRRRSLSVQLVVRWLWIWCPSTAQFFL